MAARAYWQGQIRLALVSIPVEVYPATKSGAQIAFHQIHEPTGKRVKYEKVVPGIGPVDRDDIIKGFEIHKGDYVLLDEEEIEAVKLESRKTLELVQFVDAHEIDVLYYEKPYFVVPADDLAEEAYAVLRDALKATKKVGLGQLSVRGREHLVSLKPCGKGLVLEMLRYADEVNKAQSYFRGVGDASPDAELQELAETLIDKKTAPFAPEHFKDRYVDALKALIARKSKAKGKRILEDVEEPKAAKGSNVIDLMAALKESVKSGARTPAKSAPPKKTSDSKPAARKTPAKKAAKPARKSA